MEKEEEQKILSETFIKIFELVINSDLKSEDKARTIISMLEMEWL